MATEMSCDPGPLRQELAKLSRPDSTRMWATMVPAIPSAQRFEIVSYSNILGVTGEGNINLDPSFRSWFDGDFRLAADSPCIDAATGTELTKDLDGNPRPVDVIGVDNGPTS